MVGGGDFANFHLNYRSLKSLRSCFKISFLLKQVQSWAFGISPALFKKVLLVKIVKWKKKTPAKKEKEALGKPLCFRKVLSYISQLTKYKSAIYILEFENNIFTRKSNANSNLLAKRHVFRILVTLPIVYSTSVFLKCVL